MGRLDSRTVWYLSLEHQHTLAAPLAVIFCLCDVRLFIGPKQNILVNSFDLFNLLALGICLLNCHWVVKTENLK